MKRDKKNQKGVDLTVSPPEDLHPRRQPVTSPAMRGRKNHPPVAFHTKGHLKDPGRSPHPVAETRTGAGTRNGCYVIIADSILIARIIALFEDTLNVTQGRTSHHSHDGRIEWQVI